MVGYQVIQAPKVMSLEDEGCKFEAYNVFIEGYTVSLRALLSDPFSTFANPREIK